MSNESRRWLLVASILGAGAVVLGAFGAHGIPRYLEEQGFNSDSVAKRLADFQTAARYHMFGALFLMGVSIAYDKLASTARKVACWTMLSGMTVFSTAIYAVAVVPDEMRGTFGRLAPIGGALMIAAWVALGVAALQKNE